MKLDKFQNEAHELLAQFENLLEKMPNKGNSTETCQRHCIQQQLNEVSHAINGTSQEDLNENQE